MGHRQTAVSILLLLLVPQISLAQEYPWWEPPDGTIFHYRVKVEFVNGSVEREDYPVWLEIDFTDVLLRGGVVGALDTASIRVVESVGGLAPAPEPCLFEISADFRKVADARGTIAWLAMGTTAPDQRRTWHIYFDLEENGLKPPGPMLDGALLVENANNLLANAGFEADTDGDGMPDGWSGFTRGAVASARGCSLSHWGSRSLAVTSSPGDSVSAVLDLGGIEPGGMYKIGAYLRIHGTVPEGGSDRIVVAFPGAGRAIRFSTEAALPPPGLWVRSDVVVPAPTGTDTLSVVCSLADSPDTLLIDDLIVLHAPPDVQVAEAAEALPP